MVTSQRVTGQHSRCQRQARTRSQMITVQVLAFQSARGEPLVAAPLGVRHREAHTRRCLSGQGCQEHSRAVLPHLSSEGFIAHRKPSMSAEYPDLFDAPFLKRHLGALTQYFQTHFRRSTLLFQFLSRDRAPIERRLRVGSKESGRDARTRYRHGPGRGCSWEEEMGRRVVEGHVEWFQAGASYSRLEGLAGSRWIMLVAMW